MCSHISPTIIAGVASDLCAHDQREKSTNEGPETRSRSTAAQLEPAAEASRSSAGLSEDDAIFQRLEQLEEEEEAAQAGEIGIGRVGEEGTDGASLRDFPGPANSLEAAPASPQSDRRKPTKRVSWQEENPAATVAATATSSKGEFMSGSTGNA